MFPACFFVAIFSELLRFFTQSLSSSHPRTQCCDHQACLQWGTHLSAAASKHFGTTPSHIAVSEGL